MDQAVAFGHRIDRTTAAAVSMVAHAMDRSIARARRRSRHGRKIVFDSLYVRRAMPLATWIA